MNLERLRANFSAVRNQIAQTCRSVGRSSSDITLIVVTKGQTPELMQELLDLRLTDLGENRVQEAELKRPKIPPGPRWHMIGHLQSNKARRAIDLFDVIHSVDRPSLARELQKHLGAAGRTLDIFVQVNVAKEAQKGGITDEEALPFVDDLRDRYPNLNPIGLMTMAPESPDPEKVRWVFTRLREIAVDCGLDKLSMGMSQDYRVAIEEGATHLRIGSAFFEGVL